MNIILFKKFLDKINDGHGELIISDLLETVINELDGTLTINKLEGDAALFYALPKNTNEFFKYSNDNSYTSKIGPYSYFRPQCL